MHVNLGIALADSADLDGALREFTEAIRLQPENGMAHHNRGRVLADMNRDAEAKLELEKAVRLKGNEAEWWSVLGELARKMGDKEEASRALRRAAELEPNDAKRQYALGQALSEAGDTNGAVAAWRRATALQPEYAAALYALSRALARTDPTRSKELQARVLRLQELQRATDDAQAIGNDALNEAAANHWSAAIAGLKKAIDRCGECSVRPQLHKNLGLVYCRSGDLEDGKSELLLADTLLPGDADIAKALQLLNPE
jgi:tetratricopeptide (TPR) repeat protein